MGVSKVVIMKQLVISWVFIVCFFMGFGVSLRFVFNFVVGLLKVEVSLCILGKNVCWIRLKCLQESVCGENLWLC